jgi:hypothetical protein
MLNHTKNLNHISKYTLNPGTFSDNDKSKDNEDGGDSLHIYIEGEFFENSMKHSISIPEANKNLNAK